MLSALVRQGRHTRGWVGPYVPVSGCGLWLEELQRLLAAEVGAGSCGAGAQLTGSSPLSPQQPPGAAP